jgi:hypothetical protein
MFVVELTEWMENVLAMCERGYPFDDVFTYYYCILLGLVPTIFEHAAVPKISSYFLLEVSSFTIGVVSKGFDWIKIHQ